MKPVKRVRLPLPDPLGRALGARRSLKPLKKVRFLPPEPRQKSMKKCSRCQQEKPESEFGKKRGKPNAACKACILIYWKKWYSDPKNAESHRKAVRKVNRKRSALSTEFLSQIKQAPCADCGGRFHPWQMDFDHVKGEKVNEIGSMLCRSRDILLKEIAKCELVCANCHRHRTYMRRRSTMEVQPPCKR